MYVNTKYVPTCMHNYVGTTTSSNLTTSAVAASAITVSAVTISAIHQHFN